MIFRLQGILSSEEAETMARTLDKQAFVTGEPSVGSTEEDIRNNLELSLKSEIGKYYRTELTRKLWQSQLFLNLAMPKRISSCVFMVHRAGMSTHDQIDDAILQLTPGDPLRADISMTLFLEDPSSYDGGELVIDNGNAPYVAKLSAGDAVLYPTTGSHRVEPVSRGDRRVAVFWIQSMVRDAEQRQLLGDMWMALDQLYRSNSPHEAEKSAAIKFAKKARANLHRMLADV